MKTMREQVDGKCYVWAFPKTDWELQQEIDARDGNMAGIMPFKYEITTSSSNWRDDSVLVCDFAVSTWVPEGVDLVKAAISTLRDEISRVQEEADKKIAELQEKINNLALIEFKPEGMI